MTYLITAKNLFSATILINTIEDTSDNPEFFIKRHSPLFIEINHRHVPQLFTTLFREHATKVVRKYKVKNSTKYTTMEL